MCNLMWINTIVTEKTREENMKWNLIKGTIRNGRNSGSVSLLIISGSKNKVLCLEREEYIMSELDGVCCCAARCCNCSLYPQKRKIINTHKQKDGLQVLINATAHVRSLHPSTRTVKKAFCKAKWQHVWLPSCPSASVW